MLSKRHYTPSEGYNYLVKPRELGSTNLHFGILKLNPHSRFFNHSEDCEVVLVTLTGHVTLLVGHNGNKANGTMGSRKSVFAGDCSAAYIPHHTTFELITKSDSAEIVFCKTQSHYDAAAVILESGQIETPSDYQLKIIENSTDSEWIGEAISLHTFKHKSGLATVSTIESGELSTRITLYNNDILVIPENTSARLLNNEGISYQLMIRRITLPQ